MHAPSCTSTIWFSPTCKPHEQTVKQHSFVTRGTLLAGQKYPVSKRHSAFSTKDDRPSGKAPWVLLVLKLTNGVFVTLGQKYPWGFSTQRSSKSKCPKGTSDNRGILTLQQRAPRTVQQLPNHTRESFMDFCPCSFLKKKPTSNTRTKPSSHQNIFLKFFSALCRHAPNENQQKKLEVTHCRSVPTFCADLYVDCQLAGSWNRNGW